MTRDEKLWKVKLVKLISKYAQKNKHKKMYDKNLYFDR